MFYLKLKLYRFRTKFFKKKKEIMHKGIRENFDLGPLKENN